MSKLLDAHRIVLVREWMKECYEGAKAKGFWESSNAGEKIALMHSELSELLEALRHDDPPDQHCPEFFSSEIELADLIIRAFDFAGRWEMRLGEAIIAKMKYNESRPHKHGKQF